MAYNQEFSEAFLKFLGVPEDTEDIEAGKEFYNKNYGKRETLETELLSNKDFIAKATGKLAGSIQTTIKKMAKEIGADFEDGELKDKPWEEVVQIATTKIKGATESRIKELEAKIKDGGKGVEAWEKEKNDLLGKIAFHQNQEQEWGKKYIELETETKTKERNRLLNENESKLFSGIDFPKEANPLLITGFKAQIKEKAIFDLEEDKYIVRDKSGNPIPNPHKAGEYLSPEEYVKEEAIKAKLFTLNSDAGKPATFTPKTTEPPVNGAPVQQRFINSAAEAAELR